MSEMTPGPVHIADGDFVVTKNRWRSEAHQAIKITSKTIFYRDAAWGGRECRLRIEDVVFAGPEAVAKKLVEQLRSSDAQHDEENRKAGERKASRDKALIENARAALLPVERDQLTSKINHQQGMK